AGLVVAPPGTYLKRFDALDESGAKVADLEVIVTVVPLPPALAMSGTGLVTFVIVRAWRRAARRHT
ncbi:MAG: hypothetical protein ACREIT_12465, partial [Tepidisphaeraceae bacterium]